VRRIALQGGSLRGGRCAMTGASDQRSTVALRPPEGDVFAVDWLYPLDAICGLTGLRIPPVTAIDRIQIPDPYRAILDHERSMTHTLERYAGGPLSLRTIRAFPCGARYLRWSRLESGSGQVVAMAALSVAPLAFPRATRAAIFRNAAPLGRLLGLRWPEYRSVPRAFFRLRADAEWSGLVEGGGPRIVFGRRTELLHRDVVVGDIVEVLSPALARVRC
jgi:hypothetical protein